MKQLNRRLGVTLGVLVTLTLSLSACGGDDEPAKSGADPQAVMTEAKQHFDDASSVHFTMATDSEPTSGDAVLGANGTLTHQPAFEGEVKVLLSGFNADVPIIAVDDKVYAKLPLSPAYATIDPGEYGAPDPSDFADPETGLSGLLLQMDDLEETGTVREGKQVLTTYTGTLSGDLVSPIIPSADEDSTYEAVIGIDSDGRIATLKVTGDFFSGSGDVTYNLVFDDYDKNVTISAP